MNNATHNGAKTMTTPEDKFRNIMDRAGYNYTGLFVSDTGSGYATLATREEADTLAGILIKAGWTATVETYDVRNDEDFDRDFDHQVNFKA